MANNYQGTRKNFVKPAEQVVVDFDPATITPANPYFKVNYVKVVDFGAKGVTIDVLALIGNMHYSFKLGDAAMRLSRASVKAWIAKLGLPCTNRGLASPTQRMATTSSWPLPRHSVTVAQVASHACDGGMREGQTHVDTQ